MANTHSLFQDFCSNITLSQAKSNSLKTSRNALRSDIKNWFSDKGKKQPTFCWQGSFSMIYGAHVFSDFQKKKRKNGKK